MFLNEAGKVMTEAECANNSSWLASINKSMALDIRNASVSLGTNFVRQNEMVTPTIVYNNLDEASLEILWAMQEVCGIYYNIPKKCPGGGTYDDSTNSCYCANGSWNGSC